MKAKFEVRFTPRFLRSVRALDREVQVQVLREINILKTNPYLDDTVFNAVTGTYTATFDVSPFVDEVIRTEFWVSDENDAILDSALFLDNLNIACRLSWNPDY